MCQRPSVPPKALQNDQMSLKAPGGTNCLHLHLLDWRPRFQAASGKVRMLDFQSKLLFGRNQASGGFLFFSNYSLCAEIQID